MNSRMEDLLLTVLREATALAEDHVTGTHPSKDTAKRLAEAAVDLEFEIIEWHLDRTEEKKG